MTQVMNTISKIRENSHHHVLFGALLTVVLFYVSWTMMPNQMTTFMSLEDGLTTSCNLNGFVLEPSLSQTDPCLLAFVKQKMLVSPRPLESVKKIAFNSKEVDVTDNIEKLKWVQMLVMIGAQKDTQFFFVESGANDGRYLSNTLRLETLFNWNGVLIEPLPNEFKKLLKNRRVWAVNAALCVTPHSELIDFFNDGAGSRIHLSKETRANLKVPCVPLFTILTALNVTMVDYLSLDLEGSELLVLQTVPFDAVKFKIIIVEYAHIPGKDPIGQLEEFMEPKGYHLVANITMQWSADCVFVHESVYHEKKSIINYLKTI